MKMNEKRAEWAAVALDWFQDAVATDTEDLVCDFLADLMHYCDRDGFDFAAELLRAEMHYEAELIEDEQE